MSPHALAWKPNTDRRSRRSTSPTVAARHYLERVLERCSLDAIALASLESAAVVASAKRAPGGADAPALREAGVDVIRGKENAGIDGVDVFAHAVMIKNEPCVLVTAGSRVDRVKTIAADLARILA